MPKPLKGMPKTDTNLIFRCTKEQKETWEKKARMSRKSLSAWIINRLETDPAKLVEINFKTLPDKKPVREGANEALITEENTKQTTDYQWLFYD